jgi:hypothetical protein
MVRTDNPAKKYGEKLAITPISLKLNLETGIEVEMVMIAIRVRSLETKSQAGWRVPRIATDPPYAHLVWVLLD